MFISTPNNQVAAYDAKTGTLLWRYKRVRPATAFVAHPSNRGLALYGDKVYYGAGEAVVVALDAKTGKEVWAKAGLRQHVAVLHHAGAARRRRQDPRRRVRRRVRRARLRRRARSRHRRRDLAHLHDSRSGRAGQRDVAEGRRAVEDRRRVGLGHGQLRSRDQHRLLGHRQWRAVDGRPASRRQSVYRVDDRAQRVDRQASRATSSTTRTSRSTGTRCRRRC